MGGISRGVVDHDDRELREAFGYFFEHEKNRIIVNHFLLITIFIETLQFFSSFRTIQCVN
jgi:hypothetical protein